MFKNRLITALVLAPLVIAAVLLLKPTAFSAVWGGVILLAAWEWADVSGVESRTGRIAFLVALGVPMASASFWAPYTVDWLMWPVVAWWFAVGMLLRARPDKALAIRLPVGLKLGLGWFILLTSWILFIWLRFNFGAAQALYLLVLISFADIAAYFVGRRWGFTKLMPEISPGKTVEGLYGALAVSAILAVAVGLWFKLEPLTIADFVILSLVTVVISVGGDLFESLLKRQRGVKDSGSLLPGHGGVLDRIDALLASVAVFYAGSMLLGLFLQTAEPVTIEVPTDMEGAPVQVEPIQPESGEAAPEPMGQEEAEPEASDAGAEESAPEE
ncbi:MULTISPECIES: phosphatidate cytidylyltransferase [Methylococcus]|jgi:phosphatidate cytidylyltransferase|uniref:Phosphatidate cytidylyltransferase n=2 Tax=Methylococcus capsulatus TaxID=414 RepID=Q60BA5_METCA|nr:phosphatidate cytidylyltransferase [Methylococcus capsulatus]AAU93238.1 phosphatidate cytidylyltransferase [Methylococcus capsulatus str. Bath]QXP88612.1 phosphatidate cytidylyltransferase [Methylococcus capsulatus]QXP90003.1 phosphatidate cytidylyltransferase [Methylococcus capsulatus]QXP94355.1 phosphatidate cytidylyltransferase [Methylococcus capsulatus]UQN10887.1 phosphatidate cytidylyltransferase [Methylococcus capsulatus]